MVFLKILDLFHDLPEHLRAILGRVSIFDQADLDVELELVTDDLVVKPICKGGLGINDLLDPSGQRDH